MAMKWQRNRELNMGRRDTGNRGRRGQGEMVTTWHPPLAMNTPRHIITEEDLQKDFEERQKR